MLQKHSLWYRTLPTFKNHHGINRNGSFVFHIYCPIDRTISYERCSRLSRVLIDFSPTTVLFWFKQTFPMIFGPKRNHTVTFFGTFFFAKPVGKLRVKISIDMVRLDINFAFKNRMWSPFMFFFFRFVRHAL